MLGHHVELLGSVPERCSAPPQNTGDLSWNVKHPHSSCLASWLPSCGACWGRCRSLRRWGLLAGVGQSVQALKTIHRLQSLTVLLSVHRDLYLKYYKTVDWALLTLSLNKSLFSSCSSCTWPQWHKVTYTQAMCLSKPSPFILLLRDIIFLCKIIIIFFRSSTFHFWW